LSREKGLYTLLAAAKKSGMPLTIVGTGPDAEALRRTASELDVDAQFRGFLTGIALHDAVREARGVVLPSEWYENAPMSVLEAYALGKPVIGARIGGIPELVREHDTGLLFKSGDSDDLADALNRLRSMPDTQLERMGRAGREWVESAFTLELYLKRVLAIYSQLGVPSAVEAGSNYCPRQDEIQ
jgi:glycosyltransferase involved in cell wall biosynthesis